MTSTAMPDGPTLRPALSEKVALAKAHVHPPTLQRSSSSTANYGKSSALAGTRFSTRVKNAVRPVNCGANQRSHNIVPTSVEMVPFASPDTSLPDATACCHRQASSHPKCPAPGCPTSPTLHMCALQLSRTFPHASAARPQHEKTTGSSPTCLV